MTTISKFMNRECQCVTLEKTVLEEVFHSKILNTKGAERLDAAVLSERFFSQSASFLDPKDLNVIRNSVSTFQRVLKNESVRRELLREFPERLKERFSEGGVFLSFDFHLTDFGPKLIEINTNAGGAFLQKKLVEAQRECCLEVKDALPTKDEIDAIEPSFLRTFFQEWKDADRNGFPRFIAIVDEHPEEQFLYPEFLLFRDLFLSHGIDSEILSPDSFQTMEDGSLFSNGKKVDLIYNRMTDFYLSEPGNQPIRDAWEKQTVVVTPNPLDYELYAKKTNLIFWNQETFLKTAGIQEEDRKMLSQIVPFTGYANEVEPDKLWAERKRFFFKPISGYGSKAVYKGEKLTKGTFQEILSGNYLIQELVPPSERILLNAESQRVPYKMDLRAYVFREEILLLAARLYQGQTTNFRTPGGGFSPVYSLGR
ncbi:circularly permuted ATPgrasp domain protein [Leptospira gomenensis]|uniref:Circularly permuted ATPgrasp domain protein n=1 Tax=Leptospira gomenensis TaxID=2484974 RepID=A0A5F1Y8L5_9LEPT|nr:circularly permuted ATPgrasp domain protein [Leptospira gomenensis]TGK31724.1 circularly permuted ATPgrasp domain protein [Leptospira gomenensis]TGK36103.1 circularly permuted ATPgrasp domain protein [Leptospira gomenensis]TGK41647.1 circularly permuted ATPgrasp domain protein [Leptospira gomenensis]TGK61393.1 circularly permuted ATPgrasp domain protein [Leptospira gomenensis]